MLSLNISADQCMVSSSDVWFSIKYKLFTKEVAGKESQQSGFSSLRRVFFHVFFWLLLIDGTVLLIRKCIFHPCFAKY
jgi:hypothetical protein